MAAVDEPPTPTSDPVGFRRILARNVALPLALAVLSAVLFIGLLAYLINATRWVEHSDLVIARAYALQKLDLDMETGLRGFLLAGDNQFLQPYDQGLAAMDLERTRLREQVMDNPQQVDRVDRIQALQQRWNAYAAEQIALKRRTPNYQVGAQAEQGKQLKDAVRGEFDQFLDAERMLRQERTSSANNNTIWTATAFVLLMLAVGSTIAWRGRRDLLGLSATFEAALAEQRRQAEVLQAQAWLREGQAKLSERLAREQELAGVGHAALEALSHYAGSVVGAVYTAEEGGGFLRAATWGWSPQADGAGLRLPGDRTLLAECAALRRPIALDEVPAGYLQVSSALGEATARSVLLAPVLHEGRLAGVIELGWMRPLEPRDRELLEAASSILGASLESARYRKRLQDVLEETQQLNEELQVQQEELRTANEELEEQSRALKESQAHLETQQAELEQTNVQLGDQAERLEQQRDQLREAQGALEERALELQRASRYKSEFLANMSHELRTPLNSSLILARLLADNPLGNLSGEQVRFAESIYNAGNDLLNLINDILDIAKVEAGKLEVRPEIAAIAGIADGLKAMFEPVATRKGLQLETLVGSDVPATIYTDRQRLEQILRNLMANAVKFTERGSVALHVTRSGKDALAFEVRDSGIGIEASEQEAIFEAFRQADGTVSRRFGGSGLGLAISRDLARLLGGSISLSSAPGVGSTFTVIVPLEYRAGHAQQPAPTAAPAVAPRAPTPARAGPAPGPGLRRRPGRAGRRQAHRAGRRGRRVLRRHPVRPGARTGLSLPGGAPCRRRRHAGPGIHARRGAAGHAAAGRFGLVRAAAAQGGTAHPARAGACHLGGRPHGSGHAPGRSGLCPQAGHARATAGGVRPARIQIEPEGQARAAGGGRPAAAGKRDRADRRRRRRDRSGV